MTLHIIGETYGATLGGEFQREHNDCCVRAFALAFRKDYSRMHDLFSMCGREFAHRTTRPLPAAGVRHMGTPLDEALARAGRGHRRPQ